MTITVSSIGDNTVQITTSGSGNTFSALCTAVANALVGSSPTKATGWSLLDQVTTGVGLTQVFQALNIDGSTYKNIILRWNVLTQELNISTCESWNATSHVATNEAWTFYDSSPIAFNLSNCDLLLFVHPRWCAAHSYVNKEQGLWAGVFEFGREAEQDTAAVNTPCWGWISSTLWMLGAADFNTKPLQGADHTLICVPRTKSGMTGVNAAKSWAADYGTVSYPTFVDSTNTFMYHLYNIASKFYSTIFNPATKMALPIKPIHNYNGVYLENKGVISGLKVLPKIGSNMQKVSLTVDSDGNYATNGTSKDHWVLNNHYKTYSASSSTWAGNNALYSTDVIVGSGQEGVVGIVYTGLAYYVITGSKLHKILVSNYQSIEIAANAYTDIKYDGERYIYLASASNLTRLDIQSDTLSTVAIANGVGAYTITDTHIVCAQASTSTTPVITRVLRSTFAIDTLNGSFTLATFAVSLIMGDACTDWSGNAVFIPYCTSSGNTAGKLTKISPTGVPTYSSVALLLTAASQNPTITLIGKDELLITYCQSNNIYTALVQASTLTLVNTTNVGGVYNQGGNQRGWNFKCGGVFVSNTRQQSAYGMSNLALGVSTVNIVAPVIGAALNTFTDQNYMPIMYDGSRIVTGYTSGIRIWGGVNSEQLLNNVNIGQTVLPA